MTGRLRNSTNRRWFAYPCFSASRRVHHHHRLVEVLYESLPAASIPLAVFNYPGLLTRREQVMRSLILWIHSVIRFLIRLASILTSFFPKEAHPHEEEHQHEEEHPHEEEHHPGHAPKPDHGHEEHHPHKPRESHVPEHKPHHEGHASHHHPMSALERFFEYTTSTSVSGKELRFVRRALRARRLTLGLIW